jgi:hypothetical protein
MSYKVLYAKAGAKKRKLFADGFLKFKEGPGCRTAILSTEEGEDICKVTEKPNTAYIIGSEVTIGGYVVQIDEDITSAAPTTTSTASFALPGNRPIASQPTTSSKFSLPRPTLPISTGFKKPTVFVAPSRTPAVATAAAPPVSRTDATDSFWDQDTLPTGESPTSTGHKVQPVEQQKPFTASSSGFAGSVSTSSSSRVGVSLPRPAPSKGPVEQDPALMRLMRPHQVVGADFLISRLQGQAVETGGDWAGEDSEDDEGNTPPQLPTVTCTGAILADEVSVDTGRGFGRTNSSGPMPDVVTSMWIPFLVYLLLMITYM